MCSNVSYSWMERNILVNNTVGNGAAPDLSGKDALGSDQPGLTDMTLKALEVLKKRGGDDGFFLMSEAASVDKQVSNVLLLLFYPCRNSPFSPYSFILWISHVLMVSCWKWMSPSPRLWNGSRRMENMKIHLSCLLLIMLIHSMSGVLLTKSIFIARLLLHERCVILLVFMQHLVGQDTLIMIMMVSLITG